MQESFGASRAPGAPFLNSSWILCTFLSSPSLSLSLLTDCRALYSDANLVTLQMHLRQSKHDLRTLSEKCLLEISIFEQRKKAKLVKVIIKYTHLAKNLL